MYLLLSQEPEPPSGGENESNAEGWSEYRKLMAQYWANWTSTSTPDNTKDESGNAGSSTPSSSSQTQSSFITQRTQSDKDNLSPSTS